MGTTFRTVICTLENMTPDHCRILDGRFLPPDVKVYKRGLSESEKIMAGYCKMYKSVQLLSESGFIVKCGSYGEAARFLGSFKSAIGRSIKKGYKIKSLYDGLNYVANKVEVAK